jgi:hypothetical protein
MNGVTGWKRLKLIKYQGSFGLLIVHVHSGTPLLCFRRDLLGSSFHFLGFLLGQWLKWEVFVCLEQALQLEIVTNINVLFDVDVILDELEELKFKLVDLFVLEEWVNICEVSI